MPTFKTKLKSCHHKEFTKCLHSFAARVSEPIGCRLIFLFPIPAVTEHQESGHTILFDSTSDVVLLIFLLFYKTHTEIHYNNLSPQ